jgi:hypothetical protein
VATIPNQPTLIAEVPREEARAQRLARLQDAIAGQPGLFLDTFVELGEDATANSLTLNDQRIHTVGLSTEPYDLITEYFTKRDDKVVEFDEATDTALFKDKKYKKLLETSTNLRNELVKTGVMRTESRENPQAAAARNEARRYAFGFFLKRAVAWSTQEGNKQTVA